MQKLPKQKEILLGKDLKDLRLLGAIEEEIIVVVCSAKALLFCSQVLIIQKKDERARLYLCTVSFSQNCLKPCFLNIRNSLVAGDEITSLCLHLFLTACGG